MGSTPWSKFYVCSVSLETKSLLTLCGWVQVSCLTVNWCSLFADYYWISLSCPKWTSWRRKESGSLPFLFVSESVLFLFFIFYFLFNDLSSLFNTLITTSYSFMILGWCLVCSTFFENNFCIEYILVIVWPSPVPPKSPTLLHQFHSTFYLYPDDVCMFSHQEFLFSQQFWLRISEAHHFWFIFKLFFLQCPGLSWGTVVTPITLESSYSKKPNRALQILKQEGT